MSRLDFIKFKVRTSERRVGVVGIGAAGKTVFLTSLVNHLKDHDPNRFRLGDGEVTLRKYQEQRVDEGWRHFDYAEYRDAFVHKRWPRRTKDSSQYICRFERSDWAFSVAKLKLYDLPGDRIPDAMMVAKDFSGWSDHMLGLISKDTAYRNCCEEFLIRVHEQSSTAADILAAYKLALARLVLAYKPYISPSTFLLDPQGRANKRRKPEEMALDFFVGLDAHREFAPLPAEVRGRDPQLTATFARHYDAYKNAAVLPLITTLKSCHALIVLVDVTMLLAGGVGMHDDNRQVLMDLLEVLSPGQTPLGRAISGLTSVFLPHGWRPGWITKIAFVAPKLDQVHPQDRDNMITLLRRMVEQPARDHDGLKLLFTNCSAVVSTEKFPHEGGERWLRGIVQYNERGERVPPAEMQKYRVSELPDDWPRSWDAGDFSFPDVYPQMPPRRNCPPDQVNLDRILDFVMS